MESIEPCQHTHTSTHSLTKSLYIRAHASCYVCLNYAHPLAGLIVSFINTAVLPLRRCIAGTHRQHSPLEHHRIPRCAGWSNIQMIEFGSILFIRAYSSCMRKWRKQSIRQVQSVKSMYMLCSFSRSLSALLTGTNCATAGLVDVVASLPQSNANRIDVPLKHQPIERACEKSTIFTLIDGTGGDGRMVLV